jgi:hypothetical protein
VMDKKTKLKKIKFFKQEVEVERQTSLSTQATVFFGRERNTGLRVVLKQYRQSMLKGIFRELKIFTMLENTRNKEHQESIKSRGEGDEIVQNVKRGIKHDGLPVLLCYKISRSVGEILMTNDGDSLDIWEKRLL